MRVCLRSWGTGRNAITRTYFDICIYRFWICRRFAATFCSHWHHLTELAGHLHPRSVTQLLLDKITALSYTPSPPPASLVPPTSTNHDPPMGVIQWLSCISLLVGAPLPSGGPLIDLLTKDESVPSEGGGWPGWRWGEETCVLLQVGIRPSRAFFHANRHDPWTPHKEHHFRSCGHSVWES